MEQISQIINNVIDNFETLKITVEMADGSIIISFLCPILHKTEKEMLYLYDSEMNETVINCSGAMIDNNIITIFGSDYVFSIEW